MLPDHVETVNGWTRPGAKEFFSVLVIVIPKETLSVAANRLYPTVKCFVRHDTSRNKARNAVGLVINQYIDQVVMGNAAPQKLPFTDLRREGKLWPPVAYRRRDNNHHRSGDDDDDHDTTTTTTTTNTTHSKEEEVDFYYDKLEAQTEPQPPERRKLWPPITSSHKNRD
jgi:hypothetical protein